MVKKNKKFSAREWLELIILLLFVIVGIFSYLKYAG